MKQQEVKIDMEVFNKFIDFCVRENVEMDINEFVRVTLTCV